jgi:histidinol-phosphate aminotransferase
MADDREVVVVRSLTKMWGLAGLRVGYLLGPAEIVARLEAARPPWATSTLANAAVAACLDRDALQESAQAARDSAVEVELFAETLRALPDVTVWPSAANFLLLQVAGRPELHDRLRHMGFAVRRCDTFPGLGPDYLRIAVRDAHANDALAAALRTTIG